MFVCVYVYVRGCVCVCMCVCMCVYYVGARVCIICLGGVSMYVWCFVGDNMYASSLNPLLSEIPSCVNSSYPIVQHIDQKAHLHSY